MRKQIALVLCQTEFEVLSTGLSLPYSNHSRLKAGLNPHHFHRDEPLGFLLPVFVLALVGPKSQLKLFLPWILVSG
jgi:hypothetical protein